MSNEKTHGVLTDDALRAEARELSAILVGMVEGGYELETLYTSDQTDGDAFVRRAADLLAVFAAPQSPDVVSHVAPADERALQAAAKAVENSAAVWEGFAMQDAKTCVQAYCAALPCELIEGISPKVSAADADIFDIEPLINGCSEEEPSIRSIVFRYYYDHFEFDEAQKLTKAYFTKIQEMK